MKKIIHTLFRHFVFYTILFHYSLNLSGQNKSLQQLQSEHIDLRFGMFIHFNINTYHSGWGNERVDPKIFNPYALDCRQWAKAAKSAGIKYAILTTKHHDGFALWPSKQIPPNGKAPYTIAQSSIPNRDVVREYVDAFRSEGIQPGLYFSIWDVANGIGGPYSKTDTIDWEKTKPYLLGQIKELLGGKYGKIPVFVVDGYMWKMGHQQIPYQEIRNLVKTLQPNCLFVDHNGGIPWEVDLIYFEEPLGIQAPDGNTIAACQGQTISKDWFWDESCADSSKLKSTKDILGHLSRLGPLYTNFIINCPPNRTGLLDKAIVDRLSEVGKSWKPNLTRKSLPVQMAMVENPITPISASASSGNAMLAIDGLNDWIKGPRFQTLWQSDTILPQSITIDFGSIYKNIDLLMYLPRKDAGNTNGCITSYKIYVSSNDKDFKLVHQGTWAADQSIKRAQFTAQTARYLRLEIVEATGGLAVIGELTIGSDKNKVKAIKMRSRAN
jgi:alpha-L-fucosidase